VRSSVNDYKTDSIPETTFHRWRNAVQLLFDIKIKCNDFGEYYIEETPNANYVDWRARMVNLFAVNSLVKDSKALNDRILFEPVPSSEKYLTTFIEAMRDGTVLEMTYQSFYKPVPSTFPIETYCLKMFRQRWYIVALSRGHNHLRVYSLDRIKELKPTSEKYILPADFDGETYFKDTYGVSGMEYQPQSIEIKVVAIEANYFRTLPLHHSQEEIERNENFSIFRYNIIPSFEFTQELLKQGANLEVLSPQWYRDEFAEKIAQMHKIYK
jgi:predicted DNA-binding transcriptional regulator YafY